MAYRDVSNRREVPEWSWVGAARARHGASGSRSRLRGWAVALAVAAAIGLTLVSFGRSSAPRRGPISGEVAVELRTLMVFESVTIEPQPVITGTMDGDCYLSVVAAGGYHWVEHHNRFRDHAVHGQLRVVGVGNGYASAEFTANDASENGTFVTTSSGGFYPISDPCGF